MKVTVSEKRDILKHQDGKCALCQKTIPATEQICFDQHTYQIVCRRCMQYMACRRNIRVDGITEEHVAKYENTIGVNGCQSQ